MDEERRTGLIAAAVGGDGDALQQLILLYHEPLRVAVAAGLDGTLGRRIDPEDVLQQAYVAAFKGVGQCSFDAPAAFYGWLERIALNTLETCRRDLHRRKRDVAREIHERPGQTTTWPDLAQRLVSPDATPSRVMARGEATAAVLSCLARLTDEQRRVLVMRFLEGASVAEVATALGKTEPAIHMLTHRGLKELRRLMVSVTRYLTRP